MQVLEQNIHFLLEDGVKGGMQLRDLLLAMPYSQGTP